MLLWVIVYAFKRKQAVKSSSYFMGFFHAHLKKVRKIKSVECWKTAVVVNAMLPLTHKTQIWSDILAKNYSHFFPSKMYHFLVQILQKIQALTINLVVG